MERKPPGLIDALTSYFAAQIQAEGKNKGERCPGEERCAGLKGMPLYQYESRGRSPEDTCPPCHLYPTKPGTQPVELTPWILAALDLDNLREMGASFKFPSSLSTREWAALEALGLARGVARSKERRDHEQKREREAKESRLKALVGKG